MSKIYYKGDSITLQFTANTDVTGWKIRAEFYDGCNSIKLATANSGGSDEQIEITDTSNGVFRIKVAKNLTSCFKDETCLEIEREDSSEDLKTIWKKSFPLTDEQITWETP